MKVVFDTNIFVSALLVKNGKPAQILKNADKYEFSLCVEIIEEIRRVLHYPRLKKKYHLENHIISSFIAKLIAAGNMEKLAFAKDVIIKEDPADDKFLILARQTNADYLVSGDNHLLSRKIFGKTRVVTAAVFLDSLKINAPACRRGRD